MMSFIRGLGSLFNIYPKTTSLFLLKRTIKHTITTRLFTFLTHSIIIRSRVFHTLFNKYTLSIIATISVRLAMRKKTKVNSKPLREYSIYIKEQAQAHR